jgi:hypothetical protein
MPFSPFRSVISQKRLYLVAALGPVLLFSQFVQGAEQDVPTPRREEPRGSAKDAPGDTSRQRTFSEPLEGRQPITFSRPAPLTELATIKKVSVLDYGAAPDDGKDDLPCPPE